MRPIRAPVPGWVCCLALFHAEMRTAGASGVLLDWETGRVVAVEGNARATAPGSLLKPLLLAYALQHRLVTANTEVYCRRSLRVKGRPLPCSHPDDRPLLDAERALAESCNTWFASLARRMSPQDLQAALQASGLTGFKSDFADADTRILTVLGLEHIAATPMQMALAYRGLLLREPPTGPVRKGLLGSVSYGMANNARVPGVDVLGKSGTARAPGEWWTEGWFAGGVPGRYILTVRVPRGDGGVASALAGKTLGRMLREGRE